VEALFEVHRPRLRAVAYRMLGSLTEADDAVQETWLRVARADVSEVQNPAGWLTTITARVCLDALRRRAARPEEPFGMRLPDPVLTPPDGIDPEHEVLLADAVGLALLVVLDTLSPAERLAFVLHDMFAVPFDDIARIVDRSPEATRQLASRARRRVQSEHTEPDRDLNAQREVIDAFIAASREGDFERLVALLDPDIVLRADFGPDGDSHEVRGIQAVLQRAQGYARLGLEMKPALVNGAAGGVSLRDGRPFSVAAFTIRDGKILEMDFLADPARLAALDLTVLGE